MTARITFDKFHVVKHASDAVDEMRRIEQKTAPDLKGMRWKLLKDYDKLSRNDRAEVDVLISRLDVKRTARAWVYREQLREMLDRKQNQCSKHNALAVVYERHALQGRADEGSCSYDTQPL